MRRKTLSILLASCMLFTAFQFYACAKDTVEYSWTFDQEGDFEAWRPSNVEEAAVRDGVLFGKAQKMSSETIPEYYDPGLYSPAIELDANAYRYVVVEMKYALTSKESDTIGIYFTTSSGGLSQDRFVGLDKIGKTSDGQSIVYQFDMFTCDGWDGVITQIRVDPISAAGEFSIDSIRIMPDGGESQTGEPQSDGVPTTAPQGADLDQAEPADGAFSAQRTYENEFTDVNENDWFYGAVKSAYETGLMNGAGEGVFLPDGKMTVGQGIAVACRIHDKYFGGDGQFDQGDVWYQVYVDYAVDKGLITSGQFDSYTRNIRRYEMAMLFASFLPVSYYNAINDVYDIPDVGPAYPYYDALMLLYRAGIIMGNDEYGTFTPNADIKRSEVCAIISRVTDKNNRLKKVLSVKQSGQAIYLIDDNEHPYSGWDFDNRGQAYSAKGYYASYLFEDVSDVYPTMLKRNFKPQSSGILTLESNFTITKESDDFEYRMTDADGNTAFRVFTKDGSYYILKNDGTSDQSIAVTGEKTSLKAVIDLDAQSYVLYLNNTFAGGYDFAQPCGALCVLNAGFTGRGTGKVNMAGVKLYVNYAVNERFLTPFENVFPADWEAASTGELSAKTFQAANNTFSLEDVYVLRVVNQAGKNTVLTKEFKAIQGDVGFEVKFISETSMSGIGFSIGSGDKAAFTVKTDGKNLVTGNGTVLREYAANVWNTLRIEIDTQNATAFVRFNGKDLSTYPLENEIHTFDRLNLTLDTSERAVVKYDDILVFPILPEPEDYVPAPVPCESDDYYIGLHVCSLWRNGFWRGTNAAWDIISPFDELTPYMGYYDEGMAEVADWEIKWLAEHGIDYQLLCWYGPSSITEPVKFPGFSQALNDGFFNAKYKDQSKFAIMWENNFTNSINAQQFREYLIPYWVEYYFKDPSYMTIDNKLVFSIYNFNKCIDYFGSIDNVKAEMEYLRGVVKELGYDDMILMFAGAGADAAKLANMQKVGADGAYAYNWGPPSYTAAYQKSAITSTANAFASVKDPDFVHFPTVGVGFNAVARHDTRTPSISLEEYEKILRWTKDEYLTNPNFYADQDSFKSKMILLSCWNEYDEGHYINPSNLYGFGFLDTLRKVFTDDPSHVDAKPTEQQKDRINNMAPKGRSVLRPLRWYEEPVPTSDQERLIAWDLSTEAGRNAFRISNATVTDSNGKLAGTATNIDPIVQTASKLQLDIDDANYVHVRLKALPESGAEQLMCEVFFTTESGASWTASQSVSKNIETGKTVDLYFNMKTNAAWFGTLTGLRVDPMNQVGDFEVELIEIIKAEPAFNLIIDSKQIKSELPLETDNGKMMVPFNPVTGLANDLNAYYEWNKGTKTLMIEIDGSVMEFTMDHDIAVINGENVALYKAPYLLDGIPMIPLDVVCLYAGYSFEMQGPNQAEVRTALYDYMSNLNDIINSRKEYEWEFNLDNDKEGWKTGNLALSEVTGGFLHGVSESGDPLLSFGESLNLDASKYKKIIVGMKYTAESDTPSACIYFSPVNGGSMNESMSVKTALSGKSSDDKVIEYEFDMSTNPAWKGVIDKIRFDPYSCHGEFWIDYIRIIQD